MSFRSGRATERAWPRSLVDPQILNYSYQAARAAKQGWRALTLRSIQPAARSRRLAAHPRTDRNRSLSCWAASHCARCLPGELGAWASVTDGTRSLALLCCRRSHRLPRRAKAIPWPRGGGTRGAPAPGAGERRGVKNDRAFLCGGVAAGCLPGCHLKARRTATPPQCRRPAHAGTVTSRRPPFGTRSRS